MGVGEDVSVGRCLHETIGLEPQWSTGFYHRPPSFFINTRLGKKDHPEGLTQRPISFHSVYGEEMYPLDYLLYNVTAPLTDKWMNPWPPGIATH